MNKIKKNIISLVMILVLYNYPVNATISGIIKGIGFGIIDGTTCHNVSLINYFVLKGYPLKTYVPETPYYYGVKIGQGLLGIGALAIAGYVITKNSKSIARDVKNKWTKIYRIYGNKCLPFLKKT